MFVCLPLFAESRCCQHALCSTVDRVSNSSSLRKLGGEILFYFKLNFKLVLKLSPVFLSKFFLLSKASLFTFDSHFGF